MPPRHFINVQARRCADKKRPTMWRATEFDSVNRFFSSGWASVSLNANGSSVMLNLNVTVIVAANFTRLASNASRQPLN
jgi:hypothetical protein